MKTVRNYTNSELFTLANKIRRKSGCSKSEAYQKAKTQLENSNKSNRGRKVKYTGIKICSDCAPHTLNKYNLKPEMTFKSVKDLAFYMNVTVQQVYGFIRDGRFEMIY